MSLIVILLHSRAQNCCHMHRWKWKISTFHVETNGKVFTNINSIHFCQLRWQSNNAPVSDVSLNCDNNVFGFRKTTDLFPLRFFSFLYLTRKKISYMDHDFISQQSYCVNISTNFYTAESVRIFIHHLTQRKASMEGRECLKPGIWQIMA